MWKYWLHLQPKHLPNMKIDIDTDESASLMPHTDVLMKEYVWLKKTATPSNYSAYTVNDSKVLQSTFSLNPHRLPPFTTYFKSTHSD